MQFERLFDPAKPCPCCKKTTDPLVTEDVRVGCAVHNPMNVETALQPKSHESMFWLQTYGLDVNGAMGTLDSVCRMVGWRMEVGTDGANTWARVFDAAGVRRYEASGAFEYGFGLRGPTLLAIGHVVAEHRAFFDARVREIRLGRARRG